MQLEFFIVHIFCIQTAYLGNPDRVLGGSCYNNDKNKDNKSNQKESPGCNNSWTGLVCTYEESITSSNVFNIALAG
jgi:hypothetical protein